MMMLKAKWLWWVLPGVAAFVVLYFLLRKSPPAAKSNAPFVSGLGSGIAYGVGDAVPANLGVDPATGISVMPSAPVGYGTVLAG